MQVDLPTALNDLSFVTLLFPGQTLTAQTLQASIINSDLLLLQEASTQATPTYSPEPLLEDRPEKTWDLRRRGIF